jgi:hypothetical protein
MKTILVTLVLLMSAAAFGQTTDYPLTVHVYSFQSDAAFPGLYHAELSAAKADTQAKGSHFTVDGVSAHKIALEVGRDYPARLAQRHGKENFQIQTPDGKAHWFEITGTREAQ